MGWFHRIWVHRMQPRVVAVALMPVLLAAGSLSAPRGEPAPPPRAVTSVVVLAGPAPSPAIAGQQPPVAAAAVVVVRTRLRAGRSAPSRPRSVDERGRAALESLAYDWRALDYRITFRPYAGSGLGSANRRTRTITVYVKPGQSELSLRASLAHELAHALDFQHGTVERRDAYLSIRGLSPDLPWFPCNRCDDYSSPAGDFAEVFALWLVGRGDFRSRLQGPPDRAQLRELVPLFQLPATPKPATAPVPPPEPEDEEEPDQPGTLEALLRPSPPPGR